MGVPADRIAIVPYAIDNQTLYREFQRWKPLRTVLRNELGITEDGVVALYVGRLVRSERSYGTNRPLLDAFPAEPPTHMRWCWWVMAKPAKQLKE